MSHNPVKRMMKEAALKMLSVQPIPQKQLVQLLAGMHPDCRKASGEYVGRTVARSAIKALSAKRRVSLEDGVIYLTERSVYD